MSLSRLTAAVAPAALALLLAGCSKPEPADGLLGHVPADTPYVFAASRPLPAAFRTRMLAYNAVHFDSAAKDWQAFKDRLQKEPPPGDKALAEAFIRVVDAVLLEFQGHFTPQGLAELGFKEDALSVFYGLGVFPVLRTEIADPARVEAMLGRIEQHSGQTAPQAERDGVHYRRIQLGPKLALIISVQEKYLVAGVLPTAQEQRWLPQLLGLERPARPLSGTDRLATLRKDYGFPGYGDGYIDVQAMGRILTGADQGTYGDAWRALKTPAASPACQQLTGRITAAAPRMVVGLNEVSGDSYLMTAAQETSAAVAAQLQGLPGKTRLPGMGAPGDHLFSLGMGVDPAALRDSLKSLLQFLASEGSDCEWVDRRRVEAAIPRLNLVLGPMLNGFSGLYAQLTELGVNRETLQPDRVDGGLVLAVEDPRSAIGMAAALVNPALLDLEVPLDGTAVAVPAELLPPNVPPLYLAARPGLLAVAVGRNGTARVGQLLAAPVPERPLLLSGSFDSVAFMARMEEIMAMMADRLEAEGREERARQVRAQLVEMKGYANAGGHVSVSLAPDARGLLLRQRIRLQ